MSISSIGAAQQSYVSQLASTQAAQAAAAVSVDPTSDDTDPAAATSNSLTGTATNNLSSDTLQALLDLTQQDPSQQTGQPGQTAQASGAHHHHHHHGGGMQPPPSDPSSSSSTATATSADPSQTASADDTADSTDASLESMLMAA